MSSSNRISAAEQARSDYQRSLATHPEVEDTLAAPEVPAIIAGDTEGLLDGAQIRDAIIVNIESWGANPTSNNEWVWLLWSRPDTPDDHIVVDARSIPPGTPFPLQLNIPRTEYLQGSMLVSYRVLQLGVNPANSHPTPVRVDTISPYGDANPAPLDFLAQVITDEYLDDNDGKVTASIPDYPERAPGDQGFFWWVKQVPDEPDQLPHSVGPIDVNASRTFVLTRALLEAVGDGQCYGLYVLKDKAGNISRLSSYVTATVALGPLPHNLKPPQVPLAADGVIDRKDGFEGVVIEIPAFDNWKNGDRIHASWGATALGSHPVESGFPLRIPVSWAALRNNYDFTAGAAQPVTLGYQVHRAGLRFPQDGPLFETVSVNLQVVGPPNPDEPELVNPLLPRVRVRGESGVDNSLSPEDSGKDATAFIELYETARAGELLWLYWKGERVSEPYEVQADDAPGDLVQIVVPWALIEQVGNDPELPVHYIITDQAQVNFQQSLPTAVSVRVREITLKPPVFPHIHDEGGNLFLNCSSIRKADGEHGFFVHVPPDPQYLQEGVEVVMAWRVNAYPDGEYVEGTEFVEHLTVSREQEFTGINWFVQPYQRYILPAYSDTASREGVSYVRYSVKVGAEEVWSEAAEEAITLLRAGGDSCLLPD